MGPNPFFAENLLGGSLRSSLFPLWARNQWADNKCQFVYYKCGELKKNVENYGSQAQQTGSSQGKYLISEEKFKFALFAEGEKYIRE